MAAPSSPFREGPKDDAPRTSAIIDDLKNYQLNAANEIYQQFESKCKQLEDLLAKIRELEQAYYQTQNGLKEKEAEVYRIKMELDQYANQRKKFEHQSAEVTAEIERLRNALVDAENQFKALQDERNRLETEYNAQRENLKAIAAEIERYKGLVRESEERFSAQIRAKDEELRQLHHQLNEAKTSNSKVLGQFREREAEVVNLRKICDTAGHLQRVLAEKEAELKALHDRFLELQRLTEEGKAATITKDEEILNMENEIKDLRARYSNAKKANAILMKKIIVLSEDVAYVSGDDSDNDVKVVKAEPIRYVQHAVASPQRILSQTNVFAVRNSPHRLSMGGPVQYTHAATHAVRASPSRSSVLQAGSFVPPAALYRQAPGSSAAYVSPTRAAAQTISRA